MAWQVKLFKSTLARVSLPTERPKSSGDFLLMFGYVIFIQCYGSDLVLDRNMSLCQDLVLVPAHPVYMFISSLFPLTALLLFDRR